MDVLLGVFWKEMGNRKNIFFDNNEDSDINKDNDYEVRYTVSSSSRPGQI